MPQPTIALTMGDPSGVGPEVILQAVADADLAPLARWIVVGDAAVLAMAGRITGLTLQAELRDPHALAGIEEFSFGRLDARCGVAAVEYVRIATEMCLRGEAAAMVTAPLNKEAVSLSGRPFSGHTEYIAELCGGTESRMLLSSPRLSTIHVTTHVPLREACESGTERILRSIELGNDAMKLLDFPQPRIAVCGLNPHAGEGGHLGREEIDVIAPAIADARAAGVAGLAGPFPADTIFVPDHARHYDAIVAMYHDQGLPVLKAASFGRGINVTLGLPFPRTSVDHGTALDLAHDPARARDADPGSLINAVLLAIDLAQRAAAQ